MNRDALRALQDRWLNLGSVRQQVQQYGEDNPIAGPGSPTFGDVRRLILPAWEWWFSGFWDEKVIVEEV